MGQTFEVELWYEGWEDVNIYAGSATYDTGITVQSFGVMVVDNPVSTSATDVTDHSANHSVISYTEMFGTSVDLSINAYTEFYDDNISYDWSSDVDGYLGNDSSITATNLSAGLHVDVSAAVPAAISRLCTIAIPRHQYFRAAIAPVLRV